VAIGSIPTPHRQCLEGFLVEYLNYTKHQESPEDFHFWTGLTLLSAAVGRNIWYDRKYFKIFPNLFTVLVAESGRLHKSTAINMGLDILKHAIPDLTFFAEKITPEALIGVLAKRSKEKGSAVAMIKAPEFATFFGKSIHDPTILQILTDYYDNPDHRSYETKARGVEILTNVSVSMIAGSTPEWIRTSLPEDSIGGGFTSRLFLIYRTESERPPCPFPEFEVDTDTHQSRDKCIADLKSIATMKGAFKITKAGVDYLRDWYDVHNKTDPPGGLRGFYSRKMDYILKISMLLSANFSDSMIIDEGHLETSRALITQQEKPMVEVLREINKTEAGKVIERVRNYIKQNTQITGAVAMGPTRAQVTKAFAHSVTSQELQIVLQTLLTTEDILMIPSTGKGGGMMYIYHGGLE